MAVVGEPAVSIRVIRDEAAWDALRPEWDALHAVCPWASPPLSFDWQRIWWRHYGEVYGGDGPRIVTVWRDQRCLGLLPLYVRRRRSVGGVRLRELRLISTGEVEREEICPDYLNLLCRLEDAAVCAAAVWGEIARTRWDRLALMDLPDDSPLLDSAFWPSGRSPRSLAPEVVSRGVCPIADLSGGFEAYLKSLSSKTRQHARQYVRAGERPGASFEVASAATVDEFFDDLIRLHQDRWTADGQPGCFAARRFTAFHRELANLWVPAGRAVLARLSHEGRARCVLYGFIHGAKCDYYQSGAARDDDGPFESPGNTANLMLMRWLATERDVTAYDFLRGSSGHKQRWATREVALRGVLMWRPTWRAAVARSVRLGRRLVRRGRAEGGRS